MQNTSIAESIRQPKSTVGLQPTSSSFGSPRPEENWEVDFTEGELSDIGFGFFVKGGF